MEPSSEIVPGCMLMSPVHEDGEQSNDVQDTADKTGENDPNLLNLE